MSQSQINLNQPIGARSITIRVHLSIRGYPSFSFVNLKPILHFESMEQSTPNPELLRSLGKLARGLSALFWGLPAALIICAETVRVNFLEPIGLVPAIAANLLLLFGLRQLGRFQSQERPWRLALDRARLLVVVNVGMCPFLFWFNRMPGENYFRGGILVMVISAVLFLFNLNGVLKQLGAMLPDETLRYDINLFTAFNRWLLVAFLGLQAGCIFVSLQFPDLARQVGPDNFEILARLDIAFSLLFGLSPLAATMGLLWKTKEVIFESVFKASPL
jgi:hypothetical protein